MGRGSFDSPKEDFVFAWGKHRDKTIKEVPNSYLQFIINKFDDGVVKLESEKEMSRRAKLDIFINEEENCSSFRDVNDDLPF